MIFIVFHNALLMLLRNTIKAGRSGPPFEIDVFSYLIPPSLSHRRLTAMWSCRSCAFNYDFLKEKWQLKIILCSYAPPSCGNSITFKLKMVKLKEKLVQSIKNKKRCIHTHWLAMRELTFLGVLTRAKRMAQTCVNEKRHCQLASRNALKKC